MGIWDIVGYVAYTEMQAQRAKILPHERDFTATSKAFGFDADYIVNDDVTAPAPKPTEPPLSPAYERKLKLQAIAMWKAVCPKEKL
jgi:hypothetical protein